MVGEITALTGQGTVTGRTRRFSWHEYAKSVEAGEPLKVITKEGHAVEQLVRFTGCDDEMHPVHGVVKRANYAYSFIDQWQDDGVWSESIVRPLRDLVFEVSA